MAHVTRRTVLGTGSAALALGVGTATSVRAQAPLKMRYIHAHPESDSFHTASLRFAELVKERSNGALLIEVYPNGVLGTDPTVINSVRGGTLDFCLIGNPLFAGVTPKLAVLDLPFLFRDRKHMAAVIDGPIGDGLRAEFDGAGLKALATWEVGWRNLTNSKRPIRTPADLKGLKIRTTPNPAHIKAFQLLGAVPTPMSFTEVSTALEMGSVDGQENPVTLILNSKFYEVQKHLSLTRHAFTSAPLVLNKAKFDGLAQPLQKVLIDTARECGLLQRQMNEATEASSTNDLRARGMQIVDDVDREAFGKIVAEEARKEYVAKFGGDVLARIDAALG